MAFEAVFYNPEDLLCSLLRVSKEGHLILPDFKDGRNERVGIRQSEDGSEALVFRFSEADLLVHRQNGTVHSVLLNEMRAVDVVLPGNRPFATEMQTVEDRDQKHLLIVRHVKD